VNNPQLRSVLAGVMFGIWPLLMNRSGLSGNVSSMVFAAIILLGASPFAVREFALDPQGPAHAIWSMAIASGIAGTIGLLLFNGVVAKTTPQSIGALFVVMLIAQIAVPAVYSAVMNGGVSTSKAVGFALAAISAFLLNRP
jgi:hypothetical protein